jgi:hypothetical protein
VFIDQQALIADAVSEVYLPAQVHEVNWPVPNDAFQCTPEGEIVFSGEPPFNSNIDVRSHSQGTRAQH